MDKSQYRTVRPLHVSLGLFFVLAFMLVLNISAGKVLCAAPDAPSGDGLEGVKQELELTRLSLKNYKELYERKDAEIKALNSRVNKLQDGFDKFQEITDRLTQEKEALKRQQSQLAAQLKQLEAQKLILEKQNQLLSKSTKESQQKSLDIAAVTSVSKTQQKDFAEKLQLTQRQLDEAVQSNKDISRKNSDLQERYAEISVRVAGLEKNNAELQRQKDSASDKAEDLAKESAQR